MGDLTNCPNCDSIFLKTKFRDVCDPCFKAEEILFEKVYQFIRKKENRTASMVQVIEGTNVEEELIVKFIKNGKLKLTQFPNLGYKCEKCGSTIREGKLCLTCSDHLRDQLKVYQQEETRRKEIEERDNRVTYYTRNNE